MTRILIIGVTGFLGKKLASVLTAMGHEVVGTGNRSATGEILPYDRKKSEQSEVLMQRTQPDVVIDANGITSMEDCEKMPEDAFAINVEGTKHLLNAAKKRGAKFVFISTDAVFSGDSKKEYMEEDTPRPVSVYGKTKATAEELILREDPEALILRVSTLYGFNDPEEKMHFAKYVYMNLKNGKSIKIVDDWHTCPALIDDVAEVLENILAKKKHGIFHVVGPRCLTRYEFSVAVANTFGLDSRLIIPVKTEEMHYLAKRPLFSNLSTRKLQKEGLKTLDPEEGLARMRRQMGV